MRKLIVYPNLSKGGVSAVIRGRATAEPQNTFDTLFFNDKGGADSFVDLHNVETVVVTSSRAKNYANFLSNQVQYDEISVLSAPEIANELSALEQNAVHYEFHSSDMGIIENEIKILELDRLAAIHAPSQVMLDKIRDLLPRRTWKRLTVLPNLVDTTNFTVDGPASFFENSGFDDSGKIPLLWIGRFDSGKAFAHFARLLGSLPDNYVGHVVVSLEDDPTRANKFLSECAAMGVLSRVRIYLNLSPKTMANAYRSVRDAKGWLVSTSLNESFGYAVAEATSCGLRAAVSDLPVWDLFESSGLLHRVPSGAVVRLAQVIQTEQ
ncbi:glycosyltransferase involved in cell wall biosynthesis [Neomicrococcus aestuarii]|uniref:Glycosyltransferase involved in cell wall biosynthesis n=1 Tax=Neomicrococcus aestuarii TaxID=556325 RepID=A0A7W8TSU8_9MICC|nr:glycosyltransferase [Neomicrococcus aestuarii]MBB5512189.1 glycosyltransferase involved in cell wall biosynthesis [Neomicrococcus aestuarii]